MAGVIRNSLKNIVPAVRSQIIPKANVNVTAGPPQKYVSLGERVAQQAVLWAAMMGPMFYIMSQIKYYTDAAHVEGGKVQYRAETFVGSDGNTYYAKEEE